MFKFFRTSLTAAMLSSIAVVPAATISVMVSADAAYAKSEKAGGKSGKARGKSGDVKIKSKGKSSSSKGHGGFEGLFKKLTGKDKKAARSSTQTARAKPQDDPMHPSNLGNMNGALNANENAIAAHLRNGNVNGPVGLMAAYVAGRATTSGTLEALGEEADAYVALNDLLAEGEYADLDAYLESGDVNEEIDAAIAWTLYSDQERALVENGFTTDDGSPDLEAYEQFVFDGGEQVEDIDLATTDARSFDEDLYADVTAAEGDLNAESDAQQALVDYWNKSGTAPEETEDALRAALEDRATELEETTVVQDSLTSDSDTTAATCAEGETDCGVDGEDVASAE